MSPDGSFPPEQRLLRQRPAMPEGGYRANDPTAQRLGQAAGDGQIPKRGDTEQGEYQQASPPHGLHFDQGGEENVEPGQQTHDPCLRQQGGQHPEGGGDALAPPETG